METLLPTPGCILYPGDIMMKSELRDMVAGTGAWLDAQPVDEGGCLGGDAMMDLVDQLVNVVSLCQAEIVGRGY